MRERKLTLLQRGGVGNIDSPGTKAQNKIPGDTDVVPETALRPAGEGSGYENYHTGVS